MRTREIIKELKKAEKCVQAHDPKSYQNTPEAIVEAIEIIESWAEDHPGD